MTKTTKVAALIDILMSIDAQVDNTAGALKNCTEAEAEKLLEEAVIGVTERWRGDKLEAILRSEWLSGEILRRLPMIGRA
jgi:hypothetical protein